MKLYLKQKVFSWRDRFFVKDEAGNDRYAVEGEIFSWGKKLHVFDMSGAEAAFIRQKVMSWLPRFFVEINGRVACASRWRWTAPSPCKTRRPGPVDNGRVTNESMVFNRRKAENIHLMADT